MSEGVTVDVGTAVPYIVESVLSLFGKDDATQEWKTRLSELVKLSAQQASTVQCVGMPQPIPIGDIYQRTKIHIPPLKSPQDLEAVIASSDNSVIFAGPGCGKTTLLHWMYSRFCHSTEFVPLLFTLRWPNAIRDLKAVVKQLRNGRQLTRTKKAQLVLLIDGYDEISEELRAKVSHELRLFSSLKVGKFYLTCRSHYDVYDLKCKHLELGPFDRDDARKFVTAYCRAYGSNVGGEALLNELEKHHLGEFSRHPLMLTLVCILKSGPSRQIPRRSIGLLRRAIDTLTFRWDEAKAIHRRSTIPLDGEERVRCLMRIAYDMRKPQAPLDEVQSSAATHLSLVQAKGVDVRTLLLEMARFYGILVPVGEDYWEFSHRTIQDYLAARYWVESGQFDSQKVRKWDVRGAYAACLSADATTAMTAMLRSPEGISAFGECLYNNAPFKGPEIARELICRVESMYRYNKMTKYVATMVQRGDVLEIKSDEDSYALCTSEFLREILNEAALIQNASYHGRNSQIPAAGQLVAVCVICELCNRSEIIREDDVKLFKKALGKSDAKVFRCELEGRIRSFTVAALGSNTSRRAAQRSSSP